MQILQGHLWLKVQLCADADNTVAILKNWLDLFEAIGIQNAVLHCDRMAYQEGISSQERFERNVDVIRQLTDYLKGRDLVICLENLRSPELCESADRLLMFMDAINSPNLGICLDTGHLNLTENKDQAEFIHKAGKYLKALHLADNDTSGDQHLMPFGKGNVDFSKVLIALREVGYDGLYNFEIPGERKCPLAVRGYKIDFLTKAMTYLEEVTCS